MKFGFVSNQKLSCIIILHKRLFYLLWYWQKSIRKYFQILPVKISIKYMAYSKYSRVEIWKKRDDNDEKKRNFRLKPPTCKIKKKLHVFIFYPILSEINKSLSIYFMHSRKNYRKSSAPRFSLYESSDPNRWEYYRKRQNIYFFYHSATLTRQCDTLPYLNTDIHWQKLVVYSYTWAI